jgi:positive regulator of sigma E activity
LLTTGDVVAIQYEEKKKVIASTLWIWGAIGLVALFLGYMSYKMITEMEKTN